MLSLQLWLADIGLPVERNGEDLRWGTSYLKPFPSPHVVCRDRVGASGDVIWVGEADDPFDGDAVPEDNYRRFKSYAGVAVMFDPSHARVRIARTTAGSFPLFLSINNGILVSSWMFDIVVNALPKPRPNIAACRRQLEHGLSRVRSQIIEGVFMLWPGESVTAGEDGLQFREVDPVEIVLPSTLSDAARATDAFIDLVTRVIQPVVKRSARPLIEISGGLDSSCVAVAASSIGCEITSYGVIHEGTAGEQQRRRRSELVALLALNDHEAPSYIHPPFASLRESECQRTPYDCPYRIPCVRAVENLGADRLDMVLTGIGGDELTMANTYVHEEWELAGLASVSAIVAAVGRSDMFMRMGVWPVSPLVHPDVVDFCRALPQSIRQKRLLNTLALARAGLSDGFLFPRYHENFANCIIRESWMVDFDKIFSDSPIADFGIARVDALLNEVRALETPPSIELIGRLFAYRQLDVVLKTYL